MKQRKRGLTQGKKEARASRNHKAFNANPGSWNNKKPGIFLLTVVVGKNQARKKKKNLADPSIHMH